MVNIGNSFDGTTFRCPTPGYYSFQFTGTVKGDYGSIHVLKNDVEELLWYDDTASTRDQEDIDRNSESLMSFQFMLKLFRDDTVKLKVVDGIMMGNKGANRIFNGQFIRPLQTPVSDWSAGISVSASAGLSLFGSEVSAEATAG